MPFSRWLFAFFFLAAAAFAAHAGEAPPAVEEFSLENGLEVVVIPNHRVPAVSHMMWYRVGAADDPPGKSGLAHYHEHLMFQGTQERPPGEYARIIARLGGRQNAFTTHDATSYYVDLPREHLPLIMELEADRMRGLSPSDEDALKEREVIIEERRSRVENNPSALFSEQMNAALYRNHPYHVPVIGWKHEMEGLAKNDALAFHRRHYHPNNAVLVVSGDVTAAELRPLAEKYYGGLARGDIAPRRWNEEPPRIAALRIEMRHPNVRQPSWSRIYAAPSLAHGKKENSLPLLALAQVLGGGKTSRLYRVLVMEQKIAAGVSVSYGGFSLGPAEFAIDVSPDAKKPALDRIERAIDAELRRVLETGVTGEELARAKTLLKAENIYARDGLQGMARIMGWIRILNLDTGYFVRWPSLIDAITPEQITQAARDTLVAESSVTGVLLPVNEESTK